MIQPGLERIGLLLKDVQFPWKAIHVAGTNGKGSICAYASALLTRRVLRCGRFTSPHVIDRWDCIAINGKTIDEAKFRRVENHFLQLNEKEGIKASEFELLTATAFQIFNDEKIQVGVVEAGMGGTLDATNILNNQIVSVISKIARDHQNFLGNTLEEIARHKAGILRPNVPFIVNPLNEWNVHDVINQYAKDIGAGPFIHGDTKELKENLYSSIYWHKFAGKLQPFQRDNAVLAYLAVIETLKSMNLSTRKTREMLPGIKNKTFPGRFQHLTLQPVFGQHKTKILIDGAHNTDAAIALNEYVSKTIRRPNGSQPKHILQHKSLCVTWVVAMSEGKDAFHYLGELLKPGDSIITTTFGPVDGMPWVKSMDPKDLLQAANKACPGITGFAMPVVGPVQALCAAKYLTEPHNPIVLTGSLYLVGDLLREKARLCEDSAFIDMKFIDKQERNRVNMFLSQKLDELDRVIESKLPVTSLSNAEEDAKLTLKREIEKLDQELRTLEEEDVANDKARFQMARGDARQLRLDTFEKPSSGPKDSSLKEKFFSEFEDIRKQLQKLPGAPQVSTSSTVFPKHDLRHLVKHSQSHPSFGDILAQETPKVKIRAHFVATPKDERLFSSREPRELDTISSTTSSNSVTSPIRRIISRDHSETDSIRDNTEPLSPPHTRYANTSEDEKNPYQRDGKESSLQPRPSLRSLVHRRSDVVQKWNLGRKDGDQSGPIISKFISNSRRND